MRACFQLLLVFALLLFIMTVFAEDNSGPTRSVPKPDNPPHGSGSGFSSNFNNFSNQGSGFSSKIDDISNLPLTAIYFDSSTGKCFIPWTVFNCSGNGVLLHLRFCVGCDSLFPYDNRKYGVLSNTTTRQFQNDRYKTGNSRIPQSLLLLRESISPTDLFFGIQSFQVHWHPGDSLPSPLWQRGILSVNKLRYSLVMHFGFERYFGVGLSGGSCAIENQFYLRLSDKTGIRETILMERFSDKHPLNDFERDFYHDGTFLGIQRDVTENFITNSIAFLTEIVLCSSPAMGSPFYWFVGGGPCLLTESMTCTRENSWEINSDQRIIVKDHQWFALFSSGFGGTLIQIKQANLGFELRFKLIVNDYSQEKSTGTDNAKVAYAWNIGPRIQF